MYPVACDDRDTFGREFMRMKMYLHGRRADKEGVRRSVFEPYLRRLSAT